MLQRIAVTLLALLGLVSMPGHADDRPLLVVSEAIEIDLIRDEQAPLRGRVEEQLGGGATRTQHLPHVRIVDPKEPERRDEAPSADDHAGLRERP